MNDLAQAVAFLESLNLAHADLRPENILLDRNRLKLSDFDSTATIGTHYEAYIAPYGRILYDGESDQGECGTFGLLGPRTEQFSLGSLYYLINYGFEVYGNRCLTEDPYDHGPKTVDLLQKKEFPTLDGNPLIDNIIDKCWHNKYAKVSDLALDTKKLFHENTNVTESDKSKDKASSGDDSDVDHTVDACLEDDFVSKKEFCQSLERDGLLDALSLGKPEDIGFTFKWYRHSIK